MFGRMAPTDHDPPLTLTDRDHFVGMNAPICQRYRWDELAEVPIAAPTHLLECVLIGQAMLTVMCNRSTAIRPR